jgi:hypothetical protein
MYLMPLTDLAVRRALEAAGVIFIDGTSRLQPPRRIPILRLTRIPRFNGGGTCSSSTGRLA